jgi:phosphoribosylformylglycinamidine (FGAM) synthase-like enzyme
LIQVTKDLIAQHGLSAAEYKKIVEILGREPNLTEPGMFSVCGANSPDKLLGSSGNRVGN